MNDNDLAVKILNDPAASSLLKDTLRAFLDRDPVDALNDAEVLVRALRENLALIQGAPR